MPFIITTHMRCICTEADDPNDHRKDCPSWSAAESRTAVATHFEARETAAHIIEQTVGGDPDWESIYTDAQNVSELGDTFGPLPDGTVIEVKRVDWMDFERLVVPGPVATAVPITTFDDDDYRDGLLRAFNAQQ